MSKGFSPSAYCNFNLIKKGSIQKEKKKNIESKTSMALPEEKKLKNWRKKRRPRPMVVSAAREHPVCKMGAIVAQK